MWPSSPVEGLTDIHHLRHPVAPPVPTDCLHNQLAAAEVTDLHGVRSIASMRMVATDEITEGTMAAGSRSAHCMAHFLQRINLRIYPRRQSEKSHKATLTCSWGALVLLAARRRGTAALRRVAPHSAAPHHGAYLLLPWTPPVHSSRPSIVHPFRWLQLCVVAVALGVS